MEIYNPVYAGVRRHGVNCIKTGESYAFYSMISSSFTLILVLPPEIVMLSMVT